MISQKDILERIYKIVEDGATSRVEYIQQKIKVEESNSRAQQIEEELQEIEYQLEQTNLRSPLNGKVFKITKSPLESFVLLINFLFDKSLSK